MPSLADKMLARVGKTRADVRPNSTAGKLFRKKGIVRSSEFDRILWLPRRDWREDAQEIADLLTEAHGRPPSTCLRDCSCRGAGHMKLKPVQAAALADLHDWGGLFAPIVVGGGKTLTSFLAPRVLDAKKPMLFVPAKLKEKTENEWWKLATHWKLPTIRIESYERLSVAKNATMLTEYKPDFLFFDEGHRLRNTSAACTRRVTRYLSEHPTRIAIASGTLTTKTIRDYWHLLRWCLGRENMPIPASWEEMMEWASCLDVEEESAVRFSPGVLLELVDGPKPPPGSQAELEAVRAGFRRRLVESPGVIATSDKGPQCSLQIDGRDLPALDVLEPHYARLRTDWQTPDGWTFGDAVELWRHARELVCGFYNVWDPRPPKPWMLRRKWWHRFCRETLKHSRTFDTEAQIASAVSRGIIDATCEVDDFDQHGRPIARTTDVYQEWVEIRDTFKPNAKPVWIDDTTLKFAAKWLEQNDGICWVEHPCFGIKLSEMTGLPYFGRKGLDKDKRLIDTLSGGPVIASVLANNEGRNLQYAWSKNLVVSCPPNAKVLEQVFGRTHRDGQEADEVTYTFVMACKEQIAGMYKAIREAEYIEQTLGQPQKLLYADRSLMTPDQAASMVGPRWQ